MSNESRCLGRLLSSDLWVEKGGQVTFPLDVQARFLTGNRPVAVAVADLNGDGKDEEKSFSIASPVVRVARFHPHRL